MSQPVNHSDAKVAQVEGRVLFDVKATTVVDPQLAQVHKEGARLCGGVMTCLTLIEV